MIPEGKGEIDKVLVKQYPLDSIISKEPCVNAFITKNQHDFTVGTYQVYTTFNFTVKYGNHKSVTFKSNIFRVIAATPTTVDEIQTKIDDLQKQIDILKLQLQQARLQSGLTSDPPASETPRPNQQAQQSPTPADEQNPPIATTPPPQSILPGDQSPLIGCVLGVCI
jgi:hypothetical protein